MLDPRETTALLRTQGYDFFTGVPDSLLKELCACITDTVAPQNHVIAANEGGAVALAAGYHLATGKAAVVYLQNSGLGNTINPLLSLADPQVYRIPMLVVVGWRGEPGVKDEPQHIKQGRIQNQLLEALEYPVAVLSAEPQEAQAQITELTAQMHQLGSPVFLVVRGDTFAPYKLAADPPSYPLTREQALELIIPAVGEDARIVSTTGKTSREIFELRERLGQDHSRDFLTVGSMGHASMIALALARFVTVPVYCIDGDGAALMHLGALPIAGHHGPENLRHIVINNGAHESVGGQPTVAFHLDIPAIARECGYRHVFRAQAAGELAAALTELAGVTGPALLEVRVRPGSRADLGRPTTTPVQNNQAFMDALEGSRRG